MSGNVRHAIWSRCALLFALLCVAGPAQAINCRIWVGSLQFGTYIPLSPTPQDVFGLMIVRCVGQPGTFEITIGAGQSGNQLARAMANGTGGTLVYNIFRDAARVQIWGDGVPPTFTVTGTRTRRGRPSWYLYPMYGRVFANQAPQPGIYVDDPLLTILF